MSNKVSRIRRARKTRLKVAELGVKRLAVFKSNNHIYAQIIDETGSKTLFSASTADKAISASLKNGGNVEAAKMVGKAVAEKAVAAGITNIAFDRSGFRFHGRIKALADAAREHGLVF